MSQSLVPGCLIGRDFHRLLSHFQHPLAAIRHGRRKLSYIIQIDCIYSLWSRQKVFIKRRRKNSGGDWTDLLISHPCRPIRFVTPRLARSQQLKASQLCKRGDISVAVASRNAIKAVVPAERSVKFR